MMSHMPSLLPQRHVLHLLLVVLPLPVLMLLLLRKLLMHPRQVLPLERRKGLMSSRSLLLFLQQQLALLVALLMPQPYHRCPPEAQLFPGPPLFCFCCCHLRCC